MTRRIPLPEGWQPVEIIRSSPDPRRDPGSDPEREARSAAEERKRIREIEAIDAPGCEGLIERAKRDPQATADSVCREIVQKWARIGRAWRRRTT